MSLIVDSDGRVKGVEVEQNGRRCKLNAINAVVIATGGFEWDAERLAEHFPGPVDFIASPRTNSGDGHRMAEAVGAELAHMDQANINSAIPSFYEGRPHGMALFYHAEPNAILVDRTGRRFVNELTFNLGEALDRRNANGEPVHLPVWLVTDSRFLRRSPVIRWYARPRADWLVRAPTIPELAARIGVPPETLSDTVNRFNTFSSVGRDDDFHRPAAESHLSRGSDRRAGLEAIKHPPYVAISFNRSFLATKGGPRTNQRGQVLRPDGTVIPGLYCAGVAMANPIGTRAVGAGTTLGPNMTWGYICGLAISGQLPARLA
jgi:3-oxosteroid 1-dehydrogenase